MFGMRMSRRRDRLSGRYTGERSRVSIRRRNIPVAYFILLRYSAPGSGLRVNAAIFSRLSASAISETPGEYCSGWEGRAARRSQGEPAPNKLTEIFGRITYLAGDTCTRADRTDLFE